MKSFQKIIVVFFIYLTDQTSEPSVLAANFHKLIADFCISKIQFCCSCFSIKKKSYIYTVHVVGKASNTVKRKITIACLHTQFKPQALPHEVDKHRPT